MRTIIHIWTKIRIFTTIRTRADRGKIRIRLTRIRGGSVGLGLGLVV